MRPGGPQAVLIDFGIARWVNRPGLGLPVGTPPYLSPEQVAEMGRRSVFQVDYRADIFGLGILLYEMLTGRVPFENIAFIADPYFAPRPPSEMAPAVPPELDQLVFKALAKDPGQRFQTAQEMLAALKQVPVGLDWKVGARWSLLGVGASAALLAMVALPVWVIGTERATPTAVVTTAPPTVAHTLAPTVTKSPSPRPPTEAPTAAHTPTPTWAPTQTSAPTRTPTPTRPPSTWTPSPVPGGNASATP